jgi:hypothetical protein
MRNQGRDAVKGEGALFTTAVSLRSENQSRPIRWISNALSWSQLRISSSAKRIVSARKTFRSVFSGLDYFGFDGTCGEIFEDAAEFSARRDAGNR